MISLTAIAKPVECAELTKRSAQHLAEEEGLSFAGTPGPGYSEGGDVYEPKAAPRPSLRRDPWSPCERASIARFEALFVSFGRRGESYAGSVRKSL
jgi:hypothetical protein